jgi:hypothetical protein
MNVSVACGDVNTWKLRQLEVLISEEETKKQFKTRYETLSIYLLRYFLSDLTLFFSGQ